MSNSTIDERTKFGWPVVVTLIGLGVGAGAAVFVAKGADANAREARSKTEIVDGTLHRHELRIQHVEDAQVAQAAVFSAIDKKLDRILLSRRPAREPE